jgi:hypothetical protein
MGSYRIKCAVTGLPINEYDEVYVIFIAQSDRRLPLKYRDVSTAMSIHIDDKFEFIGLPYLGKYSGYGDVDSSNPEGSTEKYMTTFIKGVMDTLEVGENETHDPAVSPDDINTIDDVMNLMHYNRIRIKGNSINYAAVHKEVFDIYTQKYYCEFSEKATSLEDAIEKSIRLIDAELSDPVPRIHDGEWCRKMRYSNGFFLDIKMFYRVQMYLKNHPRVDREIATGINQVSSLMVAMGEWGITIAPLQYMSDVDGAYKIDELNALRVRMTDAYNKKYDEENY